jgi:mannose-1-phosphate guanylyltransferase/mannose-6-phosphate isomerase
MPYDPIQDFEHLVPVVLCGGSGTRLWPLSRRDHPKQYLALTEGRTLLHETLLRIRALGVRHSPIIVTHEGQRFLARREARDARLPESVLLLEPEGRNTAPAVAAATLEARGHDPEAVVLVLPADHYIADSEAFRNAVLEALPAAHDGRIVVFGIRPDHPATGYGYIRPGFAPDAHSVRPVVEFREKPDAETAARLVSEGCLWNAGMFLFQAEVGLREIARLAPAIAASCTRSWKEARRRDGFVWLGAAAFREASREPFDRAVMEKTDRGAVVALDCGWSDLGSYASLRLQNPDERGNRRLGDVVCDDVSGSYLHAESRLVAALGLRNTIVVETPDAVLVADASRGEDLRTFVEQLERNGRTEAVAPRRVQRPWGWYERVAHGPGFQVKRIEVEPHASLSLQRHRHRSEHWVVVRGHARVVRGQERFGLKAGESTFIPAGTLHRLANEEDEPLEIVEVQCGDYLGEDDIERFDDVYGRTATPPNP